MARIRTIKPEFPHSESMGRVSRDARLLFIQLWTLADDGGKLRAASRVLASLLYPYDDDAKDLIETWLCELESVHCIQRYCVEEQSYLRIVKWDEHQKIDKPSKSKIPDPREDSRDFASVSRGFVGGSGSGSGPVPVKDLRAGSGFEKPPGQKSEKTADILQRRAADAGSLARLGISLPAKPVQG